MGKRKGFKSDKQRRYVMMKLNKNMTNEDFLYGDFDGDGVPNYKDCRPLDPKKQDVEPNKATAERLRKLPIYVSTGVNREYHIMSKDAREKAYFERKNVLSMLKKYPSVINRIEEEKPKKVVFNKEMWNVGVFGETNVETKDVHIYPPSESNISRDKYTDWRLNRLKELDADEEDWQHHVESTKKLKGKLIFDEDNINTRGQKIRTSMGDTAFHELKHVKQLNEGEKNRLIKEYKEIPKHWRRPSEQEADEASRQEMQKYEGAGKNLIDKPESSTGKTLSHTLGE